MFPDESRWISDHDAAAPRLPAGWGAYALWQWTSTGSVPGMESVGIDQNIFRRDRAAYAAFRCS